MPIPLSITDLSVNPAANGPQGTEAVGTVDDYARALAAITRQVYDSIVAGTVVNLVPTGTIVMVAANAAPSGWQFCNGQALSRSTFSALYAIIGTSYGVGDGSTTFNLPDLRGVFIRGFDAGRGLDASRAIGSLQGDQLPVHAHTASASAPAVTVGVAPDHTHTYTAPTGGPINAAGSANVNLQYTSVNLSTNPAGAHAHSATATAPTITVAPAGAGSESRPVNVALVYVIKT